MKKKIIITVILISVFGLYGCSASQVEKEPVVVTDTQEEQGNEISVTPTSIPTNEGSSENTSSNSTDDNSGTTQDDTEGSENISVYPMGQSSNKTFAAKITIEGTEETINCKTYYSNIGYSLDYDIDRFQVNNFSGYILNDDNDFYKSYEDTYIVENTNPELYPSVYMTVRDIGVDRSDDSLDKIDYLAAYDDKGNVVGIIKNPSYYLYDHNKANNISTPIEDYVAFQGNPKTIETVQIGKYSAYHYILTEGTEWNSEITEYYYIDIRGTSPTTSGIFEVKLHYYNGAAEGYGSRLKAMLDTFRMMEFQEVDPTN